MAALRGSESGCGQRSRTRTGVFDSARRLTAPAPVWCNGQYHKGGYRLPQLDAKLSQILDELQKAAAKYAPGALSLGLDTIRAVAIIHLLWGFLALIIVIVAVTTYARTYWIWKPMNRIPMPEDTPTLIAGVNVASAIIGVVFLIVFFAAILNTTTWLAVIDPRLALAKMILDRVGLVP